MGFATRLRKTREARGLTQRELGDRIKMEPTQVTRYERGQFLPNAETLVSIAQVLHVSVDFLLTGETDGEIRHELPISDVPLLERFRDVQKLSKRDREAVLLLIDSVLARSDVESRLRKRAS
ncbi:MAG: helix-turn-helix transcriptional regulator [Thermoanaerobaculia bacterium]|nr:helix-turn-helix transcriptional regulator [Thermoanaerobaculia bacterium]